MIKKPTAKFPSELRLDLVSQDWVVIATGRGKKPEMFKTETRKESRVSARDCPFCRIETQEKPILIYRRGERMNHSGAQIPPDWTTVLIPNKYPAFLPQPQIEKATEGNLYQRMNAVGFHELVITRDHHKSLALLSPDQIGEVLTLYQERYLQLMKNDFVSYVSIFHNHGREAGASQPHPHSQIITTPLLDVDLRAALSSSESYFKEKGKCVYCQMLKWERRVKTRLVFENRDFVVICPFASKAAFEMIISPKRHLPYFEKINRAEREQLAEAFQEALGRLHKALNDPAYNFYLHTAPCDGRKYDHYHWHWTILPKTATWAGFEIGTRIEISTLEPEKAAEYLRTFSAEP
ncbi:MAG: galactose-1-phosphate uridylyltransferase [Candidatus Nealsonbacteria bacterium]|nr:galactose-1-phosphate uridylyltransferase [Candidatus Nealsonbacteria bacterium]